MKDDLVERCARALCRFGTSFKTIEQTEAWVDEKWPRFKDEAEIVLAIARPAILEEAAQWHEKNARYCREVSRDEPRINLDARQKARIAASHHDASAVGLRHLAHTTG